LLDAHPHFPQIDMTLQPMRFGVTPELPTCLFSRLRAAFLND
jgi:hypothetical protein